MTALNPPASSARMLRAALGAVVALAALLFVVQPVHAQDEGLANPLQPLDTTSPQATYLSFLERVELLEDLLLEYKRNRTKENQEAFSDALRKTGELFDFSEVAGSNEGEVLSTTFVSLADIFNRLPPPVVEDIPDAEAIDESAGGTELTLPSAEGAEPTVFRSGGGITSYTIPDTEITISLVEEGAREGAFLFSPATVARLPAWRSDVDDLPVNDGVEVRDWAREERAFTGHLVPTSIIDALPDTLDSVILGSPWWKLISDVIIGGIVAAVVIAWHKTLGRRGRTGTQAALWWRLSTPMLLFALTQFARRFMDEQINHSGDLATIVNSAATVTSWVALAWGFWYFNQLVIEWIIASPAVGGKGIDAHLIRLLGTVVSVGGVIVIAFWGLAEIGISGIGLGVGAGIAGLAVALAATSTMENLIGGVTVYADRPFKVGDLVQVNDDLGWVEEIGPRSTRIRKMNDTVVILPNADISRAKTINYEEREQFLFLHVVGVRYETSIDQLRTITESIDREFRAHAMVPDESDHPRVRVSGFGSSSIDIEVRAHIGTTDLDEFMRIQQELLLLIYEIVEAAGTGFAFPSSTTYLAEDTGLPAPVESPRLHDPDDGMGRDDRVAHDGGGGEAAS